jgi:hypothetical protein
LLSYLETLELFPQKPTASFVYSSCRNLKTEPKTDGERDIHSQPSHHNASRLRLHAWKLSQTVDLNAVLVTSEEVPSTLKRQLQVG